MTNAKKPTAAMELLHRARLMVSGRYRIPWKADAATVQALLRDGLIDDGGYLTDAGQEALASLEPAAPVEDGEVRHRLSLIGLEYASQGKEREAATITEALCRLASQPPAADALVSEAVSLFRAFCRGLEAGPSNRRWCAADSEHAIGEFSAALAKRQGGGE